MLLEDGTDRAVTNLKFVKKKLKKKKKERKKKTTKTQYLQSAIKPGAIKRGMSVCSVHALFSGL